MIGSIGNLVLSLGIEGKSAFESLDEQERFNSELAFSIGREMYISGRSYDPLGAFSNSLTVEEKKLRDKNLENRYN